MKTFYEQLNLSRYASPEDIRVVITQRRRALESGQGNNNKEWLDWLKKAERILLNPDLRARYDHEITSGTNASVEAFVNAPSAPVTAAHAGQVSASSWGGTPERPAVSNVVATCTTCGAKLDPGAGHCSVCGTEFGKASGIPLPGGPETGAASNLFATPSKTPEQLEKFFRAIGWSYARGTIVSADQPYQVEHEFILSRFLMKLGIYAFIFWLGYHLLMSDLSLVVLLVVLLVLVVVLVKGFLMVVVLPFKLVMSMLGSVKEKEKQVQVRDVRLRDETLREYIIRFRGELRSGHVMVGDQIEIWGRDRSGTLMARWGYNFRTQGRIWVKYR